MERKQSMKWTDSCYFFEHYKHSVDENAFRKSSIKKSNKKHVENLKFYFKKFNNNYLIFYVPGNICSMKEEFIENHPWTFLKTYFQGGTV